MNFKEFKKKHPKNYVIVSFPENSDVPDNMLICGCNKDQVLAASKCLQEEAENCGMTVANKFKVDEEVKIYDGTSIYKGTIVKIDGEYLIFDDSELFDCASMGRTYYHYKQCEVINDE